MKALSLSICLINILFFFWKFHQGALNPPTRTQSVLPTIMTVEEMEKARRGAAISAYLNGDAASLQKLHSEHRADKPVTTLMLPAVKPKKTAVAKIPPIPCHEIGPFPDQQAATAWLSGHALHGEIFDKEALTPSAYLVYYPAAKNPEQMRIQKMMLSAKGITDIWVVPSGELKGTLSLGLFNDQARASIFRNQLLQRGVQTEIKARYKTQSRAFVKIKGEQPIPPRLIEGITSTSCVKP